MQPEISTAELNQHLARDPLSVCAALGLAGRKRGTEYVVEMGQFGKAILVLRGAKRGVVLFTACGPNGKQGGNMLTLIWAVKGTFPAAIEWAKNYLGIKHRPGASHSKHETRHLVSNNNNHPSSSRAERSEHGQDERFKKVQENWMAGGALAGTPGEAYLLNRGLPKMDWGDQLRFSPRCYHQTLRRKLPALMGVVRAASGQLIGLKNIFIDPATTLKADIIPNKPSMGKVSGGAVQLHPVGDDGVLALAEGIETALGVRALSLIKGEEVPCWSVLSAGGFISFMPPQNLRRLVLYPDGDMPREGVDGTFSPGVGLASCQKAKARFEDMGLEVQLAPCPQPGHDWLDIYTKSHLCAESL